MGTLAFLLRVILRYRGRRSFHKGLLTQHLAGDIDQEGELDFDDFCKLLRKDVAVGKRQRSATNLGHREKRVRIAFAHALGYYLQGQGGRAGGGSKERKVSIESAIFAARLPCSCYLFSKGTADI